MAHDGWISIHRKIEENWVWKDKPFSYGQAWIDLILLANHKDIKEIRDGELQTFKAGTVNRSILWLSERWGWDRKKTRRFLCLLESDQMVSVNGTTHGTTITLINYDFYRYKGTTNGTTDGQPLPQPLPTNNNDNNVNNNNITSKDVICPTTSVERVIKAWNDLPVSIREVSKMTSTSTRYKSLMTRIKEYGEENVIKAVNRIRDSDYLLGNNKYDWVITFDWFVKPNNFPKVLDGNYDNKGIKKAIADDNKVSGIEPPHGGGAWQ